MTTQTSIEVPVLVAGAGPTGLTASLLLSRHGVPSLTVERHPGTSIYPRATGINVRTMEIFRSLGLEDEVRRAAFTAIPQLATSHMLLDPDPTVAGNLPGDTSEVSPSAWTSCSQFDLEPILAHAAASQDGAQVLFGTELLAFEQGTDSVIAQIFDRATDRVTEVRCQYLIAADGSRSPVREQLGIPMQGPGELMEAVSVHFRAGLRRLMKREPFFLHFLDSWGEPCLLVPTDSGSRWMLVVPLVSPGGESRKALSNAQLAELVRERSGVRDLEPEILGVVSWTMQADWAERYRSGRVFLAGDAAHRMTPAGGHGLNTGVQDAHNICWKLAAVLQGWAQPELLDSYESERMPVGQYNATHSIGLVVGAPADRSDLEIDLGFRYESNAVVAEKPSAQAASGSAYAPGARPGERAAHLWLGSGTSTLDLFGPRFTVMSGSRDGEWGKAAGAIAAERDVPLVYNKIESGRWSEVYGVAESGVVLVRPDGHVAWRQKAATGDELGAIRRALDGILFSRAG